MSRKSRPAIFNQFIKAYEDFRRSPGDGGRAAIAADALVKVLMEPPPEQTYDVALKRLFALEAEEHRTDPVVKGLVLRRAVEARLEKDVFDRLKAALGYRIEGERFIVVVAETREDDKTLLRGETEAFLHVVTQECGGGRAGITSKLTDGAVVYGKYQKIR